MCQFAGEGMFGEKQNYFKNGRIDQAALVSFIKDIKKNTSLSDEDAAIIAASKVRGVFSGRKIFCSGRKHLQDRRKCTLLLQNKIR